jgi:hypothetical protein
MIRLTGEGVQNQQIEQAIAGNLFSARDFSPCPEATPQKQPVSKPSDRSRGEFEPAAHDRIARERGSVSIRIASVAMLALSLGVVGQQRGVNARAILEAHLSHGIGRSSFDSDPRRLRRAAMEEYTLEN